MAGQCRLRPGLRRPALEAGDPARTAEPAGRENPFRRDPRRRHRPGHGEPARPPAAAGQPRRGSASRTPRRRVTVAPHPPSPAGWVPPPPPPPPRGGGGGPPPPPPPPPGAGGERAGVRGTFWRNACRYIYCPSRTA